MHEFSIAVAILELAQSHVPAGTTLQSVKVLAGPMRRVDPDAMQFAWQQATLDTASDGATLELQLPPWKLRCPDCRREWESDELYVKCQCGCEMPQPTGGDELQLLWLTVSDPAPP